MARFLNHERGVICGKHSLLRYDVQIPGRAYPWDGVGTLNPQHFENGEVVTLGFLGKNRQLPIILNQKSWPVSYRPDSTPVANFFGAWYRVGIQMARRFFAPWWDDVAEEDSSLVYQPSGLGAQASVIRTDSEGVVYWAEGQTLRSRALPSTETIETDLGAEIIALSLDEYTGRAYAIVQIQAGNDNESYAAGYAAGVAFVQTDGSAFPQGAGDCESAIDYRGEELANDFATNNPPPEGQSAAWGEGWTAALLAEYRAAYDQGYQSGGCELP